MAASIPPAPSPPSTEPTGSKLEVQPKPSMTVSLAPASSSQENSDAVATGKTDSAPVPEATVANGEKQPTKKSRRDRNAKPKKKKKVKEKAECVGYYVDALDKKMLWGEARIIQCNLSTQKIKVHFVGWSKTYDLWTDPMSITGHGRYAPITMKGPTLKSWDGDMHLFQDMLGSIAEATFTPVPTLAEPENQAMAKTPPPPVEKKRSHKKKVPVVEETTARPAEKKRSHKKKVPGAEDTTAPPAEKKRSHKKKAPAVEEATARPAEKKRSHKKKVPVVEETTAPLAEKAKRVRPPKRATSDKAVDPPTVEKVGSKRGAQSQDSNGQKHERPRDRKRPKKEASGKTRERAAKKKKKAVSPDELPLFRELELEDGTVVDFSEQRAKARAERESMASFLDKCAAIWKQQLGALSVP